MTFYDFAITTVRDAAAILLRSREKGFSTASKGGDSRDIVTSVDHEVGDSIVSAIHNAYPSHDIYSEERAAKERTSEYQWVLDPIDGTANFSRNIPHFAVSLGLRKEDTLLVGAVYNPVTEELFSFAKGEGAYVNDVPLYVSDIAELSHAHIFFHAGRKEALRDWGGESYRRLLGAARKTGNFSCASLDVCFVAAGRIEAAVYGTFSTLDSAAALGVLAEAGGVASDESGIAVVYSAAPQKIYAANSEAMLLEIRGLLER